jgi:DNA-binding protein H-NS
VNDTQLAKMSYQELLETRNKIDSALVKRRAEERRDVKAKIAALAESSGFDIGELMGGKAKGSKLAGKKVAAKFAHPKDPSLTWTGRGRQPLWLGAELKKGKKLANFAL